MAYQIKNVYNLETLLKYCSDALNWPIEEDWFEDIDDLFYEYEKERGFALEFELIDKIIENVKTVALRRF